MDTSSPRFSFGPACGPRHWIALQWRPEPQALTPPPEALGWWALQFTPHVAWVDEALLLEVSACERLWGGRRSLLRLIHASNPAATPVVIAGAATSLIALACLRLAMRGEQAPADLPAGLPLFTLTAARPHLELLARMGCRTWGQVAALPRGGLNRRFGAALREALDLAWGLRPESHRWLALPEVFEHKLELPALATSAPELMWSANRLLAALRIWLAARQRGVLAFELQWTLDLKRLNGVDLPPQQGITVRTAAPTQDMAHLRRLLAERLALTPLAAPTGWLTLRTLETVPWAGASLSLLPDDKRPGDKLHELVERLSARLGPQQVRVPVLRADHRPECMQRWRPALGDPARPASKGPPRRDADLLPTWLLREPMPLELRDGHPWYGGRLRRLAGPQRLEAGWWVDAPATDACEGSGAGQAAQPALRDYYIAHSPGAGLLWVYRERPSALALRDQRAQQPRWFLQGLYA